MKLTEHSSVLQGGLFVEKAKLQESFLDPNDHYIAGFVSDTPQARVLRVRLMMGVLDGAGMGSTTAWEGRNAL
ncbi:MAG: hypothetical protein AAF871_07325 [Pseudomonadota bacterium]